MVRGYFIGPNREGRGDWGIEHRHLSRLMEEVYTGSTLSAGMDQVKVWTREDLRYWRAAIMVLDATEHNAPQLRQFITEATGTTPSLVDGVWLWDVRPIVDGASR
jgi:hypothetical protein